MKILALDTATEACSAALLCGDSVYARHEIAPRRHAELILSMVDGVLTEAGLGLNDLDAVAFGRGPGAFTGVRIAAGVTQGLALGAGLPVIPLSSLATLAQGAADKSSGSGFGRPQDAPRVGATDGTHHQPAALLPAIDARMGEIYWGVYDVAQDGLVRSASAEQVTSPDAVQVPADKRIFGVGSGWGTYRARLESILDAQIIGIDPERYPLAKDMLPLAAGEYSAERYVSAEQALPVYLRDDVVRQG